MRAVHRGLRWAALLLLLTGLTAPALVWRQDDASRIPLDRREVVFWHFWGGADRDVVEKVVARFNARQDEHFVRAVAMPGNNLDLKLFLAIAGGDPPDVINQDDPIVADWATRGALTPLDELATSEEIEQLSTWLYPAARRLGEFEDRFYALGNGLDIRALYYNRTMLQQYGLSPPETLDDLDLIAERIAPSDDGGRRTRFGYLPDPRRIWAWAIVFGGGFYDAGADELTIDHPANAAALTWMASYSRRFGAAEVAAFRQGDQSLPGKTFPLLAGRYAVVMDGQWRVRDILAHQESQRRRGDPPTEFGVCPLPPPPDGRERAGWVNGNFFLVPRGATNPTGAWEFMKFWSGFGGLEAEAAQTCVAGGWIPVSAQVVSHPVFQQFLQEQPLFAEFVSLASSPNQFPTPVIPGAPLLYDEVVRAAEDALYQRSHPEPRELLHRAQREVESRRQRLQTP